MCHTHSGWVFPHQLTIKAISSNIPIGQPDLGNSSLRFLFSYDSRLSGWPLRLTSTQGFSCFCVPSHSRSTGIPDVYHLIQLYTCFKDLNSRDLNVPYKHETLYPLIHPSSPRISILTYSQLNLWVFFPPAFPISVTCLTILMVSWGDKSLVTSLTCLLMHLSHLLWESSYPIYHIFKLYEYSWLPIWWTGLEITNPSTEII